jgi:putative sterol carrier protein
MDLNGMTQALRTKMGESSGLNATLKFDCGEHGCIYLDGKSIPNTVSNENRQADCTIGITPENLAAMMQGELDPATAFMTGKLKVEGDMSVALKLQRVM